VIRETLELARPLAMERGITLEEAENCGGLYVMADRQRLRQALLNLVSNAIKYNREHGSVSLACSPAPDEAAMLRIGVSDTGPGISPEMQDRLFKPFDRLGAEQSGVEGTGLGLTLSQRLIEAMGGRLGVTSLPGQGSTFWIDLALTESSLQRGQLGDVLEVAAQGRLSRPRTVLYIEDNVDSARLVERIFARWAEVRLIAAMQGRLGLDLARQHHPDLVLLDLHLPDISGLEVLQRLRADPATRDIPVVITSADATPGQVERLLKAGADDYLTKPLDVHKFAEVVRSKLE
jgi:CheY-like chemotaxis protein